MPWVSYCKGLFSSSLEYVGPTTFVAGIES